MTQQKQIYKCEVCGNIVEVLHTGAGELVCCGQSMILQVEKNEDEGMEKHVPVIEKAENGFKVKVGSQAHPMEESHYIEWVEIITDGKSCRKFLKAGNLPEVEFNTDTKNIQARVYCNVHGLWKSRD